MITFRLAVFLRAKVEASYYLEAAARNCVPAALRAHASSFAFSMPILDPAVVRSRFGL